eukprot:Hpha_TRINITY_DN29608_c0_g1::TRINITY_DN29608_c0_g1_i1::g.165192::m.165192/K05290/PIGK; phosphatidylinositol glycan, class K
MGGVLRWLLLGCGIYCGEAQTFETYIRDGWLGAENAIFGSPEERARDFFRSAPRRPQFHTNNWAVIVDTSRFWSNYRHVANALTMYHLVRKLGLPDSNIVLMLGDDVPCNPRNVLPGTVFHNRDHAVNLYGDVVEVDYRGYDVTVENFVRVLTGRFDEKVPPSKRMDSDTGSNVMVFMTGHGGEEFLKFQDATEINSQDLRDAFSQMWTIGRYHSLLFMVETCQAASLLNAFTAPNIIAIGSSMLGENSYSHHNDDKIGLAVIDRWTYYLLEYLQPLSQESEDSLLDLFSSFTYHKLHSNAYWTSSHKTPLSRIRITDFFSVRLRVKDLPLPRLGGGLEVAAEAEKLLGPAADVDAAEEVPGRATVNKDEGGSGTLLPTSLAPEAAVVVLLCILSMAALHRTP